MCVCRPSQLEQEEGRQRGEVEELQARVSSLQAEKRTLALDKAGLAKDIKRMEAEWELSRHASRSAILDSRIIRTTNYLMF